MTTPLDRALSQARADWLAGSPDAWARYLACLRRIGAPETDRIERPRCHRRTVRRRPRAEACPPNLLGSVP